MRHANKINHLGRKTAHRKSMLKNMSCSLLLNKRIFTTLAKAKALRMYLEPVITKSKENTTHNRRTAFSYLGANNAGKAAVKELFDVVAAKIADRPGGYLRIIKTGFRKGDGAEMAMVELVDFNEIYTQASEGGAKKKTRRRGAKKSTATAAAPAEQKAVEETPAEEPKADAAEESAEEKTEE